MQSQQPSGLHQPPRESPGSGSFDNTPLPQSPLAKYRLLFYVLLAGISFVYILFGYKKEQNLYNGLLVFGCILVCLLFFSYATKARLVKWLQNETATEYKIIWFLGSAALSVAFVLLLFFLLYCRKTVQLRFGETRESKAKIISVEHYYDRKNHHISLFDTYQIQYPTENGIVIQELKNEDVDNTWKQIPVLYSVSDPDLFEIIK